MSEVVNLYQKYTPEEVLAVPCSCGAIKGEYCYGRTRKSLKGIIPDGRRKRAHGERYESYERRLHTPMFLVED